MRCRILSLLLGVSLALVQSGAWAKHVCKYDSVRTTAPASRFTDNGDGTVTDAATGLQWKRCSEGQTWNGITCTGSVTVHTWRQALQLADGASYAGSDDWRLPNIKDLTSIVEQACYGPAIDLEVFPGTPSGSVPDVPLSFFWSSSPAAGNAKRALIVRFHNGYGSNYNKYDVISVRLVRGELAASAGSSPLNDTGLDWWADESTNDLLREPPDYPGQDASHGRDANNDDDADGHAGFVFTKLDADGKALPSSAASWSCVRDEVTGMIWERKTNDGGLHDKNSSYTWYNPDPATNGGHPGKERGYGNCHYYGPVRCDTEKFVIDVNAAGLCGAHDWRLPTREDLRSLVDYSRTGSTIDTAFFPDLGVNKTYWSSSPHAYGGKDKAWIVNFTFGQDLPGEKRHAKHVRLVRSGRVLSFCWECLPGWGGWRAVLP